MLTLLLLSERIAGIHVKETEVTVQAQRGGDAFAKRERTDAYVVTSAPESWELAFEDIRDADPEARLVKGLSPGVLVVQSELALPELTKHVRMHGTFVRHIFPLIQVLSLHEAQSDVAVLVDRCLSLTAKLDSLKSLSVQTRVLGGRAYRGYDVNIAVSAALAESGFHVDVKHPEQVISIVCTDTEGYIGVSAAKHNLSDWAGGIRRFAREDGQISRAEFKLLEALEVFSLQISAGGMALDFGAAPGGWTRVLRSKGLRVVAVDPAPLDSRLKSDSNIMYVPATAQEYLSKFAQPNSFDLLVNDMRMDPISSANLMCHAAPLLKANGAAVMTLKLKSKSQRKQVRHALEVLVSRYAVLGTRKLFHNRSEVTVALQQG